MPITSERPHACRTLHSSTRPWFDEQQVSRAVTEGRSEITYRGIRFSIEGGHWFKGEASRLEYECALVKRADGGFVPMAYVRLLDMAEQP